MRVLFLAHDSSLYGAQLSLAGLLTELDRNRCEPFVVAPMAGPFTDLLADMGIEVIFRPLVPWIFPSSSGLGYWGHLKNTLSGLRSRISAIARVIERNEIDIVYTNTVTCIEGALAAQISKRPHIWHLREQVKGNSELRSIMPWFLVRWIVGVLSRRKFVNSRYLYRAYDGTFSRGKLEVIYNGVDPAKFDRDRAEASRSLKTELGHPVHFRIVATIGSIIPRKGQLLFVDVASRVLERTPDAAFLVVGQGDQNYLKLVKDRVRQHGLERRFHFLGWRSDIPRILAGTDVLAIAADEEPFGRTVIEAMAADVPVVSTRCGGPEEIVLDGITGVLVPRGNPSAMAGAIMRILREPSFAANLVRAGKERLYQEFTLQAHTKNVQFELERVMQSSFATRTARGA